MATILPFNKISEQLNIKRDAKKVLLDTCALMSFSHDTNEFHDETIDLFETLRREKVQAFTNINIRSEFVDLQRRLIITEALTSLAQDIEGINSYDTIAKKLKSHKNNVHKRADSGNPLILSDSNIKQFKKQLSFGHRGIQNVWGKFCEDNLQGRLVKTFEIIERVLNLKYLSLRKGEKSGEVIGEISWENMYRISEKSGLSIHDSMILNMFEGTNIPFLITTDFDLVYASAISAKHKIIFCPKKIYEEYANSYFSVL